MIRFVYIGNQILEDVKQFAWYDTVTDTFLTRTGSQVWGSWEEFEADSVDPDIEQFRRLFKLPE